MTTLVFVVSMFFTTTTFILVTNYFFRIFSYPTMQRVLLVISYTVILIFYGIKKSERIWDENTVIYEGIDNIIEEIDDDELKELIIKRNRIMAIKRHRSITNSKFNTALRYVNLIGVYYSNQEF